MVLPLSSYTNTHIIIPESCFLSIYYKNTILRSKLKKENIGSDSTVRQVCFAIIQYCLAFTQ